MLLNDAAARILDLRRRTGLIGRHCREALRSCPEVARLLLDAFRTEAPPNRAELELRHLSDLGRTIGYTLSHVRDRRGEVTGATMFFKDLTRIERLEEQARLKDRLAVLGQMAAGLAHEMRNPLAAIEIHAGLLRRALDPALGAHAESLDHILAEVRRLNEAVATVLDFVRPVEIAERPVDVEALLEAATRQPCAGTVRIERDYAPGGTVALGDPGQLRQVFENLLRNAYEAVGASGTIHLRTRLVREGARVERPRSAYGHDALPAEEVAEPEVLVEIADDGPGIPPDVRDKVFQPFFTTKPRGSGLGLALVQKIVQSHRGRIDFTNGPGRGTVFRVVLPAVLGDAA